MSSTSINTSMLPYEDAAYRSFYEDEFLAEFNHGPFAKGATDLEKAKEIVAGLNESASKVTSVVRFNPDIGKSSYIEGGICSVISFQVAVEAFKIFEQLRNRTDLTEEHRGRILANRIALFVNGFHALGQSNKKNAEEAKKHARTVQQAFNTILVKGKVAHHVQEKMKALASFYNLQVSESTPSIQVSGNTTLKGYIENQTRSMKEGIYILRVIDHKDNHKQENCGHTIIYIKGFKTELYFDPRLGLYQLFEESKKTNIIYNALISAQAHFKVDFLSFHKLEKNEASMKSAAVEVKK